MKVLVTAIGGDIAQSVLKCLRHSHYKPFLIGCDCDRFAGGRGDVDLFIQAPPVSQRKNYSVFLRDLIKSQNIRYVFPIAYEEIQFYHSFQDDLQNKPAFFIAQEAGLFETLVDKYATVQFLKEKGLPYPRTWLAEDYDHQLDFPLVLKKRRGSGGKDFYVVRSREELHFWLSRTEGMIVQEYIPGDDREYTAGLFSDGGSRKTITFKRKLAPGGFSRWVELVEDKKVAGFPQVIAEALDFIGSLNVQFRLTGKGCVPLEFNPRFSSTVYFRHLFGFKDVEWSLDLVEDRPVIYRGPLKKGVGVRTLGEYLFAEDEDFSD